MKNIPRITPQIIHKYLRDSGKIIHYSIYVKYYHHFGPNNNYITTTNDEIINAAEKQGELKWLYCELSQK